MWYQPLGALECKTSSDMVVVYKGARRRLMKPRPELVVQTAPSEPPPLPAPRVEKSPLNVFTSVLTLTPVEEVKISALSIISAVAKAHDISMAEMKGPRRNTRFVAARHHAIALLCQCRPDLSYPVIGLIMNRDHSTVMHGKKHWPKIAGKFRAQSVRVRNLLGFQWQPELKENIYAWDTGKNTLCTEESKVA